MKPGLYEQVYGKRRWIYLALLLSLATAGLCLWNRLGSSFMSPDSEAGSPPGVLMLPAAKPAEPVKPVLPPPVAQGSLASVQSASTPDNAGGMDGLLYRVQSGNCLWRIAKRHCGTGFRWPEIYRANSPAIIDPDLIYPGQEFKVTCGK